MSLQFNVYRRTRNSAQGKLVDIHRQATPTPERCAQRLLRSHNIINENQGFCVVYDGTKAVYKIAPELSSLKLR